MHDSTKHTLSIGSISVMGAILGYLRPAINSSAQDIQQEAKGTLYQLFAALVVLKKMAKVTPFINESQLKNGAIVGGLAFSLGVIFVKLIPGWLYADTFKQKEALALRNTTLEGERVAKDTKIDSLTKQLQKREEELEKQEKDKKELMAANARLASMHRRDAISASTASEARFLAPPRRPKRDDQVPNSDHSDQPASSFQ